MGTSTDFSLAKIHIDSSTSGTSSTNAIAGMYGAYTFNPTAGGVQVGNRFTITNAPTTATNTAVGQIIRMSDNTALANTVRGLEVVASVGTNSLGTNTGIRTTGGTFGIQAFTTGLAGGSSTPAALYGENLGTTQGDALRLYSSSVTSASAMQTIYHEVSTFTGTGILMNLGANGGGFTGKFVDFKKNGTSAFTILNSGSINATGTLSLAGVAGSTSNIFTVASSSGTNWFNISSNGNIGISSSTPASKLSVVGTAGATTNIFTVASSSGTNWFSIGANGRVGISSSTPVATLGITGLAGVNPLVIASSTGVPLFTFGSNGRMGIGTTTPSASLAITAQAGLPSLRIASSSGATTFIVDGSGRVAIGTSTLSSSSSVMLTVAGDLRIGTSTTVQGCLQSYGGGVITGTCSSDENLKTNILDIENVAQKFQALRVVNFNWNTLASNIYGKDTSIKNTGYIAQNVESIFPELVITDSNGYKQVDYSKMGLYAAEGVKELSVQASQASTTLSTLGVTVANNYASASSSISALSSIINNNYTEASTSISSLANTVANNYAEASSSLATTNNLINTSTTNLQAQISAITDILHITNAPSSSLIISSTGVIGIGNDGTPLGGERLRISGRVRATGFDVDAAADLAENFEAVEAVDAGTVVAFSSTTTEWNVGTSTSTDDSYTMSTVRKARLAHEAIGVVSTNPGITLGKSVVNGVPVAFSGRIPVKVTTENGEVHRGDYLTVSATMPGHAMKLTGEGRAIGRALSDYIEGRDKVLMLVESGLQKLDLAGNAATTTGMLTTGNIDLNANGVAINNIKSLASANGTWSIDENGRVVAKQLCLEDLCIDKNTLTNILQIAGQSGIVLGVSTSTATSSESTATSTSTSTDTGTSTPVETPPGDSTPPVDTPIETPPPTETGSNTPPTEIPPSESTSSEPLP